MLTVSAIPAFNDNYIWLVNQTGSNQAYVVDPGCGQSVINYISQTSLNLAGILITHHHADHTGGIELLQQHYGNKLVVYGPNNPNIKGITHTLTPNNDGFEACVIPHLETSSVSIIAIPGHTLDHIAYLIDDSLFCGDTLFSAGCGRIFEGTPAQMMHSLGCLATLSPDTKVYCAHEYTESNVNFALHVTPKNDQLLQYAAKVKAQRSLLQSTIPTDIKTELLVNPFLRCHEKDVIAAVSDNFGLGKADKIQVFTKLREWKNHF